MRVNHLFRGALLVIIGILLLLVNFGYIHPSIWWELLRLWPVLLIALGLKMIGSKDSVLLSVLAILLVLGAIGYSYYSLQETALSGDLKKANFDQAMHEDIEEVELTIHFGEGEIDLRGGTELLAEAKLDFIHQRPTWTYHEEETTGKLIIEQDTFASGRFPGRFSQGSHNIWNIKLNNEPAWSIVFNSGACKVEADFRDLDISRLIVNTGASDVNLTLGEQSMDGEIVVKAGASNIELTFPKEAGVKISKTGALSSDNLDSLNFIFEEDYYYSPNFYETEYVYEVDITTGVSSISVKLY